MSGRGHYARYQERKQALLLEKKDGEASRQRPNGGADNALIKTLAEKFATLRPRNRARRGSLDTFQAASKSTPQLPNLLEAQNNQIQHGIMDAATTRPNLTPSRQSSLRSSMTNMFDVIQASNEPRARSFDSRLPPISSFARHNTSHQDAIHATLNMPEIFWKQSDLNRKFPQMNQQLKNVNGDTLVYLYTAGDATKPPPTMRVDSTVIRESGSIFLTHQLDDLWVPRGWPDFHPVEISAAETDAKVPTIQLSSDNRDLLGIRAKSVSSNRRPEPRASLETVKTSTKRELSGIQYEIYLAWPGPRTEISLEEWYVTTRNFFAILYNANTLLGASLFQSLARLLQHLQEFPEYLLDGMEPRLFLIDYILLNHIGDVSRNPATAVSILAFSEHPDVKWRDGYIEAFTHCAGQLKVVRSLPGWSKLDQCTRMYLSNAELEMEGRIHGAQRYLKSFDFTEMWPMEISAQLPERLAFDRLRSFFLAYYQKRFTHWPPSKIQLWLNREVARQLARDIYGLYDYLIDRTVVFERSDFTLERDWVMATTDGLAFRGGRLFNVDSPSLPLTSILVGFDDRHGYCHIPHPYPLVPTFTQELPVVAPKKKFFFRKRSEHVDDRISQVSQKQLSYSNASNIYSLAGDHAYGELLHSFAEFEKADMIASINPTAARRGRWILLYGIMQILATVSVDNPTIRIKRNVKYHLSAQLKGLVPWRSAGSRDEEQANPQLGYLWEVARLWSAPPPSPTSPRHQVMTTTRYGDGRSRGYDGDFLANNSFRPESSFSRAASSLEVPAAADLRARRGIRNWVAPKAKSPAASELSLSVPK